VPGHKLPVSLVQIEPTSRCTLACLTCLRGSHPQCWQERDLDASILTALLDILPQSAVLHLQGWGEPLLYLQLPDCISQIRQAGMRISLTSNGTPVDGKMADTLVASRLDSLTFSMAGATGDTQDALRGTGSFACLEQALDCINTSKKEQGRSRPTLAISYLLTPKTIHELPGAVSWSARRGVSLLAGVHLTHAVSELQKSLQCFSRIPARDKKYFRIAELKSILHRMRFTMPPMTAHEVPVCAKNPLETFFVAADGSVSPCVFLCPPCGSEKSPLARTVFGNLYAEPLDRIWNSARYTQFRQAFARRLAFYNKTMARVGLDLDALERLDRANQAVKRYFGENQPPQPCRHCLKMQGA
jgi:MoaA/NifB/PqqE/SkfB family radical SAM enzyme